MAHTNSSPLVDEMDQKKMKLRRLIPVAILLLLMLAVYLLGLHELFTYESLKEHRDTLKGLVHRHPYLAPFIYIVVYAFSTSLSIPGGTLLSIFGGFLFPQPYSTLFVVIGATIGATAIFSVARTLIGEGLREKAGPRLQKMRKGFQENAANYLLFLRLVPLFPFWLVNLAPAFFGVSLVTFIWTTVVGIIPGAFVLTQAGVGLDAIFASGEAFTINTIFNNQIKIALAALGFFALLPVLIKKMRKAS